MQRVGLQTASRHTKRPGYICLCSLQFSTQVQTNILMLTVDRIRPAYGENVESKQTRCYSLSLNSLTVQRKQYEAVPFNRHLQSALNTTHDSGEQAVTIVTTITRLKLSASV